MHTQKQMILAYLKKGRKLTALGAIDQFGCTKLSTRVGELIYEGHRIHKKWVNVKDRFGQTRRVVQYSL